MDELDKEYKKAIVQLNKDLPKLINAMRLLTLALNDHSIKIERWVKLGK